MKKEEWWAARVADGWCPDRVTLVTDDPAEVQYPCALKAEHEGLHQLPVEMNGDFMLLMEWDGAGSFSVRPMD